uniref:Translocation protein SEC62 n=1 Tax=Ascaris lumbricoides TaxID=6252 RepID=A0A0M3HUW0_ASCLU
MALFKKLKKSKEKHASLPDPEPVKQLDKRVGLDTYRDFFTLKNYWKAIDRRRVDAGNHLLHRRTKYFPSIFDCMRQTPEGRDLYG